MDFVVFPVDATQCKLQARTHMRRAEIKAIISVEALLFYICHDHITIDHEDGISCLQLEGNSWAVVVVFSSSLTSLCPSCLILHVPHRAILFIFTGS